MKVKSKVNFLTKITGKDILKKLNPFEVHINRSKHQVLERKIKSDYGLPGISRSRALQKRKKTLLQEYKMKDKNHQFIDQRIGERNPELTEDDRIMARFTAERVRIFNKKTMFNLSDSEVLTHRGQTLSEIERFEDTKSDDDEDDPGNSGALKGKFVGNAHFGGGMLTKNKQDRDSLIDELINESKKRKAERQYNKEETLEATEQLDKDWKTLGLIVTSKSKDALEETPNDLRKRDAYDFVIRQLKFEPHGLASQRLKTDEEISREDKEQLEKLESERLKQLRVIEANKYGYHQSADDLDDGFSLSTDALIDDDSASQNNKSECSESYSESDVEMGTEESEGISSCFKNENEQKSKPQARKNDKQKVPLDNAKIDACSGESMEHEEYSDVIESGQVSCTDSAVEATDNEECIMDDLTDLMPVVNKTRDIEELSMSVHIKPDKKSEKMIVAEDSCKSDVQVDFNIPFVIEVPESYESLKDILNNRSVDQQNIIFDRLIKSNHPSLEPVNKKKMLRLAEFVIQLVQDGNVTWKALPTLVLHFSSLKEFNREECLKALVESISIKLNDFHSVYLLPAMKFLVWYTLLFSKPQGMDVLLPVSKPALSLACKIISGPLSHQHVTTSLLCCCLMLQDVKISSTVYTDAVILLHNYLKASVSRNESDRHSHVTETSQSKSQHRSEFQPSTKHSQGSINEGWKLCLTDLEDEGSMEETKVLHCCVVLLSGFVNAYRKYPQSKIVFKPIEDSLNQIKVDTFPLSLKEEIFKLQVLLKGLFSTQLHPLVKEARKPKALRQYEPCFHTVMVGKYHRGLPAEKQEEQKLLHKYKHEMKGAIRELRRDNVFLANVKLGEKARSDEQRMRKVKEIFGSAATQQGELRSLKRNKK